MNNEMMKSIMYLYTAFNSLDTYPNNTKLSQNDEFNIHNALMLLERHILNYTDNGYIHIKTFYDACSKFYYHELRLKGVFVKYFVYDYYKLHECVEKMNKSYEEITKIL